VWILNFSIYLKDVFNKILTILSNFILDIKIVDENEYEAEHVKTKDLAKEKKKQNSTEGIFFIQLDNLFN
jgi:hypothetical protein